MRSWVVGGAVIETEDGDVLLVKTRRRNGRHDWSPPGGVIEVADGEALLDGLTREVREETGLEVTSWYGPIYEIETEAPDLGWHLRVEVYRALAYEGTLAVRTRRASRGSRREPEPGRAQSGPCVRGSWAGP